MLRGGVDAGTARKLLRKVSKSVNSRRLQLAAVRQAGTCAAADVLPDRGVFFRVSVDRRHLGVVAVLVEVADAREQVHTVVQGVVGLQIEVHEVDGRLGVHSPPSGLADARIGFGDDRVALGVEHAALERDAQLAHDVAAEEVDLRACSGSRTARAPRRSGASGGC